MLRPLARTTILAALCVAVLILVGCGREDAPTSPTAGGEGGPAPAMEKVPDSASTPPPLESRLHEQWQEKVKGLDLTRASGANVSNKTMRALVEGLSPEEFEQLRAGLKAVKLSVMTPFQRNVLGVAVRRVMLSGDRAALVGFLAERCPREIPPAPIEYTLAAEERRGKVTDGFTVLVDAYRASANDESRAALLDALASALPSLRAQTPEDDAFVDAAEAWHTAHKGRFKLRPRYVFAWQDHRFSEGAEELFETE